MAVDKAIDSTAFDAKLTLVADAIRQKSGKTNTMSINQMPSEITSLKVADVSPFTEILTGVTNITGSYTWTLPKSENLLAGYLINKDCWNVKVDLSSCIQKLFFTTIQAFGAFDTDCIGAFEGGTKGGRYTVVSNTMSYTHVSIVDGVLTVSNSSLMPLYGNYWYCLVYGVKS